MKSEKQYITERLVNTYGLWFKATKRVATPDFWVYMLARKDRDQKFSDLRGVAENLADDIYAFRGDGKPVTVTAITQPPHLQVSRSKRGVLPWEANIAKVPPFVSVLGAYWNGPEPRKMAIDLSNDDYAVGAFFGSQGSGKSSLLHIALLGLCRSTPPDLIEVYGADLKKGAFEQYERLPHVRFTASTEADAMDLLRWLESLCYAATAPRDGKIRVLFADELQMLIADSQYADEFFTLIRTIFQLGREWGIRVVTATQNPNKDNYPPDLKPLTHYMGAGRTKIDGYLRSQLKIIGARDLLGKGDFIFDGPNGPQRFKSFWLSDEKKQEEISALIAKWGDDPELIHFVVPEEEIPEEEYYAEEEVIDNEIFIEEEVPEEVVNVAPPPPTNQVERPARKLTQAERKIQADVEAIAPLMAEAWDAEYEEIRTGFGVQLIEAIYGEPKQNAGNYKKRMLQAVEHWLAMHQPNLTNEPNERTEEADSLVWVLPDGNKQ